jgi:hypothetical protein
MTELEIYNDLKNHEGLFNQYLKDNTVRFANPADLGKFNHYAMILNLGVENLGCRDCIINLITKLSRWYNQKGLQLAATPIEQPMETPTQQPVQQNLFAKKKRNRRKR